MTPCDRHGLWRTAFASSVSSRSDIAWPREIELCRASLPIWLAHPGLPKPLPCLSSWAFLEGLAASSTKLYHTMCDQRINEQVFYHHKTSPFWVKSWILLLRCYVWTSLELPSSACGTWPNVNLQNSKAILLLFLFGNAIHGWDMLQPWNRHRQISRSSAQHPVNTHTIRYIQNPRIYVYSTPLHLLSSDSVEKLSRP